MKRLLLALLFLLAFAADASACNRCGIFGRGCRFVSHAVVQQVAYTPPVAASQNFIFNNTFPVPHLAQQAQSVYGYSLAAAPYSFDSTAYMDRASRFQELALETAQTGINGFNANAAAATALADSVDRRTKNAMVALATIQANQQQPAQVNATGTVQTTTTRYSVRNGQIFVDNDPPNNGNQQDFSANALQSCARCHDGTGQHHEPRDVVLDGSRPIDWAMYERCFDSVRSGKMPKGVNLSAAERFAVLKELPRLMVENQAQQPAPLPAPPQPQQPIDPNRPPNF